MSLSKRNNCILITGGAGFIGSYITNKLLETENRVIVLDNFSTGRKENIINHENLILHKIDIYREDLEPIFINEKPDFCIHLAAQTKVTDSAQNPYKDAELNILSSIKLLSLCKTYQIKKFITASSAAVYGTPKYLPIDEMHPTQPISPYGLSKLTMEKYVQLSNVPYIIFRFSNAFGARQQNSNESVVITISHNAMINDKEINIYGDGEQLRDFIYVEDIADIVIQAINSPIENEIFNVSINKGISINYLLEIMGTIYDYKKKPIYLPARGEEIKESILNNDKIKRYFNNIRFCELEDGLMKMKKF